MIYPVDSAIQRLNNRGQVDIAVALINPVSVAQKMKNAIHQINLSSPLDNATGFLNTYPLNSDLSGGSAINTIYYG